MTDGKTPVNSASWKNGEPKNLQAAAEDAYEWLKHFREGGTLQTEEGRQSMDRCIKALRDFMRPNAEANARLCRKGDAHEA